MNPRNFLTPPIVATVALILAACGGPSQDPVPTTQPQPSQAQEQARADAAGDDEALRVPSRPEDGSRQPRGLDDAAASTTEGNAGAASVSPGAGASGGGFAPGHPVPDEARGLLGEWVVSGHRLGAIAALDDSAATGLHGREISYGDSHANSGADSCGAPRYHAERRNVVEALLADYRTTPIALGLDQGTDAEVTVIEVECAQPWVTLGSRVLVLADGVVLAPWDGVFFELRPR